METPFSSPVKGKNRLRRWISRRLRSTYSSLRASKSRISRPSMALALTTRMPERFSWMRELIAPNCSCTLRYPVADPAGDEGGGQGQDRHRGQGQQGQLPVDEAHQQQAHHEGEHPHEGHAEGVVQEALDRLHVVGGAGHQVAGAALLEEPQRQPQQMAHVGAPDVALHVAGDAGEEPAHAEVDPPADHGQGGDGPDVELHLSQGRGEDPGGLSRPGRLLGALDRLLEQQGQDEGDRLGQQQQRQAEDDPPAVGAQPGAEEAERIDAPRGVPVRLTGQSHKLGRTAPRRQGKSPLPGSVPLTTASARRNWSVTHPKSGPSSRIMPCMAR